MPRTRAADDAKAVQGELNDTYHVARTEDFLSTFFSLDDGLVEPILETIAHQGLYDVAERRWTEYPISPNEKADAFCDVLCCIFKAISEAVAANGIDVEDRVETHWTTRRADYDMMSANAEAMMVRPGILSAILTDTDLALLEAKIAENHAEIESLEDRLEDGSEEEERDFCMRIERKGEQQRGFLDIWWRQTNIVAEVMPAVPSAASWTKLIQQVSGYVRQVFRAQLDRRFAFGIAICFNELSVWLYDRSGVVGTAQPIDIHKNPEKLIQVVAAMSLFPSHELGWDPTMKLYLPKEPEGAHFQRSHVYHRKLKLEMAGIKSHWAIAMPGEKYGDPDELFVTVSTISAVAVETMSGPATIIWEALRYREIMAGNAEKIYVLKQAWRSSTSSPSESQLYTYLRDCNSGAKNGLTEVQNPSGHPTTISLPNATYDWKEDARNIGNILSTLDMEICGQVDSTVPSIRHGLPLVWVRPPNHHISFRDGETQNYGLLAALFPVTFARVVTSRTLTRMLMDTFGWPIKFFRDKVELLSVLKDIIQGHRFCYYNGVLQRDVSLGNGLIVPADSRMSKFHGCLIDLDHASVSFDHSHPRCDSDSPEFKTRVEQLTDHLKTSTRKRNLTIEEAVVRKAVAHFPVDVSLMHVLAYIEESISFHLGGEVRDRNVFLADLGWDHEVVRPTFQGHSARSGDRTGTAPFMSAEVWDQKRIYSTHSYDRWCHDAIHDMESFFWVLVYICITRKGPGGERRDELKIPDPATLYLRTVVYSLFDGPESTLISNKRDLLEDDSAFESFILPHFHPYFAPLRQHVLKWWKLLGHGYNFRAVEHDYIHDYVLCLLDEAITEVGKEDLTADEQKARAIEMDRRAVDRKRILSTFSMFPV